LKQRRGSKKAIIALARKILVIIYSMLKTNSLYDETSYEVTRERQKEVQKRRIIFEAKKLGLQIIDTPQAV
jgi:hypothetical protein